MVTTDNAGGRRPADGEGARSHDRANGEPKPRHDADRQPEGQRDMANNAVLEDDFEAVLRELTTDFQSTDKRAAAPPGDAPANAQSLPPETGDKLRLPHVGEFEIARPTDYNPDRKPYDDRITSEAEQDEYTPAHLMARKLAPRRDGVELQPETYVAAENAQVLSDSDVPGNLGDGGANSDDQWSLRLGKRHRRRGRAQRMAGNPAADQLRSSSIEQDRVKQERWNPPVLRPVVARSSHGASLGAGLAALLVVGTTALFGFVEPLNRLLPDPVAAIFKPVSRGNLKSADHSTRTGNAPRDSVQIAETVTSTGDSQAAKVKAHNIDIPSIAGMPADRRNVEAIWAGTLNSDKSVDLFAQDSLVQTILMESGKRALEPARNETRFEVRAVTDAGSVTSEIVKLAPNNTVGTTEIAGVTPDMADGNDMNSDELAATIMNLSPLDPDARQPEIPERGETALTKQNPNFPASGVDSLLAHGQELLQRGNIATARLLFHRVVAMGDSRGAKGMGMTYDPEIYQRLPVAGLKPDSEQAEIWYLKAKEMAKDKRTRGAAIADNGSELKN